MKAVFVARFTMLAWWHIGTGFARPGSTDDVQANENGLPIIPARHVKGLARDEARTIDTILGTTLTDLLFGSGATPGTWAFNTARPIGEVPRIELGRGIRVDHRTGVVGEDDFFDAEWVQGGVLDAVVEGEDADIESPHTAFVAASLMAVERVGARKGRGRGKCRVTVHDVETGEDISTSVLLALEGGRA